MLSSFVGRPGGGALPELVSRDDWGYPVLPAGAVPAGLAGHARRAVRDCPTAALRLTGGGPAG